MDAKLNLSSEDRIIVHLLPFHGYAEDMVVPFEITQKGIADAVGVKLTQVSRLLSALSASGLIEFRKAHVQGIQKKVKTYFLTKQGISRAGEIMSGIEDVKIPVMVSGSTEEKTYAEIKKITGATVLQIIDILNKEGYLELSSMKPLKVGTFLVQHPPKIDFFVGREKEQEDIENLIEGPAKAFVIYGNPGYGKSTLLFFSMKKFSDKINMFWFTLNRRTSVGDILRPLSSFLTSIDKMGLEPLIFGNYPQNEIIAAIASRLEETRSILIFDGYGDVRDEVVEFFIEILKAISALQGIKIIFTAPEDTPYYCRFYGPKEVEAGIVQEYHLAGLSYEDTGKFLEIEDGEKLRRMHRMTSGNPSLLKLIKEGNRDELKHSGRFSTEEINMLMYLAGHGD